MTETTAIADFYRSSFERFEREGFHGQPEAVRQLRQAAMDRFEQLGFPTTRMEAWRNTSVEPIAKVEFRLPAAAVAVEPWAVKPFRLQESFQVVVAGGRFVPDLSLLDGLPEEVEVRSLAEVLANVPERVLPHLGRYADFQQRAFVALNTAFISDGVFISVPEGTLLERPIHVIYFSPTATRLHPPQADYAGQAATVSHTRTLVVTGENSRLTVMEHYIGLPGVQTGGARAPRGGYAQGQTGAAGGPTFTNAVTEIVAGAGSIVDYIRVQQEPDDAYHVATVQTHQEADSRVALHTVTVGGGLVRNDVNTVLAGDGAEVVMNGLYLVKGRQHVDNHTRIDHAAPHCTSMENYKGIVDDQGHGIFNGRIVVRPKAQKTNATQSNHNLILSDKALVNTDPQLEIYADDVKCTHGSTVGQIDEDVVFYFLSRGIDRGTARRLLIHGFTQEIISRVENNTVRKFVNEIVSRWLPNGKVPIRTAENRCMV